jgi:hypothetical protein
MSQKLTPIQQYRKTMLRLNRAQPITPFELSQRVDNLRMLATDRPKKNIYDMASSLGAGLTAQAQSGRPSSVGYGLSLGFKDFNDQINKNKELAEQEAQQLRMMAYEEAKAERDRARKIEETVAQNIFETQVEAEEDASGFGSSYKGILMSKVQKVIADPNYRFSPEYGLAYDALTKPTLRQLPDGSTISEPGVDLRGLGYPPPAKQAVNIPKTVGTAGGQAKLTLSQGDPEYNVQYSKAQMQAHGPYPNRKSPAGNPVYISGYVNGKAQFSELPK